MTGKRVTLREVAKAAGVHVSTASRALDVKSRNLINAKVVDKIVKVSEDLGYRPNIAAYSLKTRRTRMIGVIVPDITNAIFPPIIRGIEDALLPSGYLAMVGNTDGDHKRESNLVDVFMGRGVDGLILASVQREDDVLDRALSEGIPLVTVNRHVKEATVSSVVHDEHEGVRRVLTHLASLGHRRIAHIAGPQSLSTGSERYEAFMTLAKTMRLETHRSLIGFANAYNEQEGERSIEELLARGREFTAVVCANDRLAVGAIGALTRRNINCPGDVSITGYNDMPMMDRIYPPLTTVRIQQYKMGYEAGNMLRRMIDKPAGPEHLILPVELVIRGSTGPAHSI